MQGSENDFWKLREIVLKKIVSYNYQRINLTILQEGVKERGNLMKRIRKVFAALLVFAMVLLLFPASARAESNENTDTKTDGIVVTKTAALTDDGTYTIDISAYATGTTTTTTTTEKSGVPLDIVLVLDQSGSMYSSKYVQPLKNAVTSFVNNISANAKEYNVEHRIAMVGFASNKDDGKSENGTVSTGSSNKNWINTGLFINGKLKNYGGNSNSTALTAQDYKDALVSVNTNGSVTTSVTTAILNISGSGATRTSYGIEMANGVFENNPIEEGSNRQRIVVVFTDGKPGQSGYDNSEAGIAVNNAYTTKNAYNAKVYTIGLYSNAGNNVTNFMNYLSSNYPNARRNTSSWSVGEQADSKYYMTTSNSAELDKIFTNISKDVTESSSSTSVTLDSNAVLKDIMANGLKMTDNSDVAVTTVAGTINSDGVLVEGENTAAADSLKTDKSADMTTATVTGFGYSQKYIADGHPGEVLKVQITGVIPSDESVTNAQITTNDAASGIYGVEDGTEKLAVALPQPTTILTSKAYVLDYAKEFTMNSSDWKQTASTLYGSFAKANADSQYGSLNGLNYTPKTTKWDGYDTYYAFGKSADEAVTSASANTNGNLWSKVSVIPANNVYYEDDFVSNENSGTVGIEYIGSWTTDGTASGNKENADGDVQGWESSLADDNKYSDGSAHAADASSQETGKTATASFTFTGTGVDIYSRTNDTTGTIYVTVKSTKDGKTTTKRSTVDNKANSGDYYQIPTYTFSGDYGTYEVTVRVTSGAASEGRTVYYLDGIRVYNPINPNGEDATVQGAYGADEISASFTEVRNILQSGAYFVDENENGESTVMNYSDAGVSELAPNHEVYLDKNQSVVIDVSQKNGSAYYIGLKSPTGAAASAAFSDGANAADASIGHTTDLYYKVTPNNGTIVIKNTGDSLLSVTKLRIAGIDGAAETNDTAASSMTAETAQNAAVAFNAAPRAVYQSAGTTDEELTAAETPEVTENESLDNGETAAGETGEVIIENPDVTEEQTAETSSTVSSGWVQNLFSSIRSIFGHR